MRTRAFFALLLIALVAVVAYTLREEPHKFSEDECLRCHADVENEPGRLMAPVERLCGKCHRSGLKGASHPVNIKPEVSRVPADMPLTDGILTCNTCHNVHEDRYTAFGAKSYYLRRHSLGREFCISCHEENPIATGHRAMLDVAHMSKRYRVTDESQPLDSMSLQCIGCHDGATATSADYTIGGGYWKHLDGAHPIGVDYSTSWMKKRGLTPASRLDGRIRLFNGRLGCGTCHNPYSGLQGQLVMDNTNSRLCSECHYDK